mgnify:CR=1 FL=1
MMRGLVMAAAALLVSLAVEARSDLVTVASFDDILFWTGSGTNEAALVLQFPTATAGGTAAPAAIAWGYRWNGSATMADMVLALSGSITIAGDPGPVAGADPRLAIDVADYGVPPATDYFLDSITYSQAGLPAGWSQGTREMPGWDGTNWNVLYTLAGNGSWTGDPFAVSNVGMSSIVMGDGDWYGFVHADGPAEFTFAQPVSAVPEPATWTMLAGAAGAAIVAARRRARRA